jgi:hypothetical protein
MVEGTPLHVGIRGILKDRPCSRKELFDKLKIKGFKVTQGRLDGTVSKMIDWEEVKAVKKGVYALIDYTDLEGKIYDYFVKKDYLDRTHIPKEWLVKIAYEIGENYDDKFLKEIYRFAKKHGISIYPQEELLALKERMK